MPQSDEQKVLEAIRTRLFSGEDRDLYLHVGYFFTWHNQVDWKLTNLMAIVRAKGIFRHLNFWWGAWMREGKSAVSKNCARSKTAKSNNRSSTD